MPKNGFPMPTAKNRFQILKLHPKKHMFKKTNKKKNMVLNQKKKLIILHSIQNHRVMASITGKKYEAKNALQILISVTIQYTYKANKCTEV